MSHKPFVNSRYRIPEYCILSDQNFEKRHPILIFSMSKLVEIVFQRRLLLSKEMGKYFNVMQVMARNRHDFTEKHFWFIFGGYQARLGSVM